MTKFGIRERGIGKILSRRLGLASRAAGFEQFGRELSGPPRALHDDACDKISVLLKSLGTTLDGLSSGDVRRRRIEFGFNEVVHERPPRWHVRLFHAFKNPFIALLIALGAVAFLTQDFKAASIIAVMVLISVLLRFVQESRSTAAAERLKAMVRNTATVTRREVRSLRDGPRTWEAIKTLGRHGRVEIPLRELVPGDIVHLSAGDMVPADVRLVFSKDLFVSQAVLTGESMPVEKSDLPVPSQPTNGRTRGLDPGNPLGMSNLCFMGTNVISGTATAIVLATGNNTYFGSMARRLVGRRVMTSFDRGVSGVSWLLIRFTLALVPLVFVLNIMTKGDLLSAFFFGLAVAVGLTPEMLPMIVSANLARGAVAMLRKKVIVKKLDAIQNLGAMDVLCTDKTGTLTQDRVILEHHLDVLGAESEEVLRFSYLNSYHQTGLKNLLDVAILRHAEVEIGLDGQGRFHKVDEMPFDFERRRMSVVVEREKGRHILISKGAVEEIFKVCSSVRVGGEVGPINASLKRHVTRVTSALNNDGLRVIAVAVREFVARSQPYTVADEREMTLIGYLAFLDPPKETALEAVQALQAHGVRVVVLTGDNELVTRKVCQDVGLEVKECVLGHEIETLGDDELGALSERATIVARLNPTQKARVIQALRSRGHTVGYLGDGINDAPALRSADVGVSVDTAVDIAKESADIILLEKSLLVLEEGVVEGRKTFLNILKYIKMAASSNFGNMLSVLGASVLLPFLPMLPLHLLVQNLLYDLSQTLIPFDSVDEEELRRPRVWSAQDIGRFMLLIGPVSSIFDYATFAVLWYILGASSAATQGLFQSGWFVEGLLSQVLIVHMIRTRRIPFLQSRASLPLSLMTAIVMAAGIAIPFSSLGSRIGLGPLPLAFFPWLIAILTGYFLLTQLAKRWYLRRFAAWL